MEIFFKKTFDSWEFFKKELDDFCDEYFLILRKEDCKIFNETDKFFDTFRYQYVKFECVYGGKPREKHNTRKDQSSEAIECSYKFRLRYDKKLNKHVITERFNYTHKKCVGFMFYLINYINFQKKFNVFMSV